MPDPISKISEQLNEDSSRMMPTHESDNAESTLYDRLGMMLGTLCAIHCALTPIAITLAPLTGFGGLWSPTGELTLLIFAFVLTLPSVWVLINHYRSLPPSRVCRMTQCALFMFVVAWSILIGSTLLHESNHQLHNESHKSELSSSDHQLEHSTEDHHSPLSLSLSTLGGLGLACAHLISLRHRRLGKSFCGHDLG